MVSSFFKEVMLYMASYTGIVFVAFAILAWMMSGLLWPYLRTKLSRGKFVLVKVKTVTQDYFRPGKLDKGFLVFKDRAKEERRISIPTELIYEEPDGEGGTLERKVPAKVLYRSMGVNVVDVDDERNAINTIDYTPVTGFDGVKYNDLYIRALYKPNLFDKKEKVMLALIVIIFVVVIIEAFLLYDLSSKVAALGQISAPVPVISGGP